MPSPPAREAPNPRRPVRHALGAAFLVVLGVAPSARATGPRIDRLEPDRGPIAGGTRVVVRGQGFEVGTVVAFDEAPGLDVEITGPSELRVTSPPHPNGFASLRLQTSAGEAYASFLFLPPPLSSLAPGQITTVAGIGKLLSSGRAARTSPLLASDVAVDSGGVVYVVEHDLAVVWRIAANGLLVRIVGTGREFVQDVGDGGPALAADLSFPRGVAIGPDGDLY